MTCCMRAKSDEQHENHERENATNGHERASLVEKRDRRGLRKRGSHSFSRRAISYDGNRNVSRKLGTCGGKAGRLAGYPALRPGVTVQLMTTSGKAHSRKK